MRISSSHIRLHDGAACAPEGGLVIEDFDQIICTDNPRDLVKMFRSRGPSKLIIDSTPMKLKTGSAFMVYER